MSLDIRNIEKELRNLWRQMATPSSGSTQEQAVLRACVMNLVVYTHSTTGAREISRALAEISESHPSRILVLSHNLSQAQESLSAHVTALCHLSGGRKQVCCEQIIIEASEKSGERLPSLLRALLMPDLPVVLWWKAPLSRDKHFIGEILDLADQVVLDTEAFPDPLFDFSVCNALLHRFSANTSFKSMGWASLQPWRNCLANLFDAPERLAELYKLERLEIECGPHWSNALLLLGWLASTLHWKPLTCSADWTLPHNQMAFADSRGQKIEVDLLRTEKLCSALLRVNLYSPAARFSVLQSHASENLETNVQFGSNPLEQQSVVYLQKCSQARLLASQMETPDRDPSLERSISYLAEIV